MKQLKERGHPDAPPPMATDGDDASREAMVKTWGEVPPYGGLGRPPTEKQPGDGWHYLQVVKYREGGQVVRVEVKVIYGDETTLDLVGGHTSYVERTNLTSRQMNGRLVRKTLSFSKELEMLKASAAWEDAVYNLTRTVKTLRVEVNQPEVNEIRLDRIECDATDLDQIECDAIALNQPEFDRIELDEIESAQTEFNEIEIGEMDLNEADLNEVEPNQNELNQTESDQIENHQTEFKEVETKKQKLRYQQRSPAMAAGLTDHIWTIKELLMIVVAPT